MENPSKYLTDKTIKNDIEKLSIGTSSTRGNIIKKLIDDKYIERKKGYLCPTDFGMFMIHTIRGISLCRIDTTGQWEQILTKVREGEITYEEADKYFDSQLDELIKDIKGVNKVFYGNEGNQRKSLMLCPNCGKDIMIGPRNYYCSGYRDGCKYSLMKEMSGAKFTEDDAKALFNGKVIEKELEKKDKSAKWLQGLKFNPEEGKLDFVQVETPLEKASCPDCEEKLFKSGNKVYCKRCEFSIWGNIAGVNLTDEELYYIFRDGISKYIIKGFKSKKGTTFDARIGYKKENGVAKFEFKFT